MRFFSRSGARARRQHAEAENRDAPGAVVRARTPDYLIEQPPDPTLYDIDATDIVQALLDHRSNELVTVDKRGAINKKCLRVKGQLDLESVRFELPLTLNGCEFEEAINLIDARLGALDLQGSKFPGLAGRGAQIDGDLDLSLVESRGAIDFRGATIGGNLFASGAKVLSTTDIAIICDHARIRSSVFLTGAFGPRFESIGTIRFLGALIDGSFEASGAKLDGNGHDALSLENATVKGAAFFNVVDGVRFESLGAVRLVGATIGGGVELAGAQLDGRKGEPQEESRTGFQGGEALILDGAHIAGNVFLRRDGPHRFEAVGTVRLVAADIGGVFDASGAKLDGNGKAALYMQASTVRGSGVYLRHAGYPFEAIGAVSCLGMTTHGSLVANGARFVGDFVLEKATIKGITYLGEKSEFLGYVNLTGAALSEICDDQGCWPKRGRLYLEGLSYKHFISSPATAQARLEWLKHQPERNWLGANIRSQPFYELARVFAAMGKRVDAQNVLFEFERLRHLADLTPWSAVAAWLLLASVIFSVGEASVVPALIGGGALLAVDALVMVLRRAGLTSARLPTMQAVRWLTGYPLRWFSGYGYRPYLALVWLVGLYLVSTLVFDLADRRGVILSAPDKVGQLPDDSDRSLRTSNARTPLPGYPEFRPSIYALNLMIPGIDLEQVAYWQPIDEGQLAACGPDPQMTGCRTIQSLKGHWLFANLPEMPLVINGNQSSVRELLEGALDRGLARTWMWGEILFGALLAIIAVAAFTGLLTRRDQM